MVDLISIKKESGELEKHFRYKSFLRRMSCCVSKCFPKVCISVHDRDQIEVTCVQDMLHMMQVLQK